MPRPAHVKPAQAAGGLLSLDLAKE